MLRSWFGEKEGRSVSTMIPDVSLKEKNVVAATEDDEMKLLMTEMLKYLNVVLGPTGGNLELSRFGISIDAAFRRKPEAANRREFLKLLSSPEATKVTLEFSTWMRIAVVTIFSEFGN